MNGNTKFLTINSKKKWKAQMLEKLSDKNLICIDNNSLTLQTLKNIEFNFQLDLPAEKIIDASIDNCDILFLLIYNAESRYEIHTLNPQTGFHETKPLALLNPISLKTGLRHIYVFDGGDNTIQKIDKVTHSIQILGCLGSDPCDIAVDGNQRLILLDKNNQVYLFDNKKFEPFLEQNEITKIKENGAIKCKIGKYDKKLYVLGTKNTILVFSENGEYEDEIKLDLKQEIVNFDIFDSDNLLLVLKDRIIVSKLSSPLKKQTKKAFEEYDLVSVSNSGMICMFDSFKNKLDLLKHIDNFIYSASYVTTAFDSIQDDTVWHKITLDCKILPNTQIDIFYYSSNISSLPEDPPWKKTFSNPSDVLINAKGRYLWIKIKLGSLDGNSSPEIFAIKAFFPRLTYLEYLPTIYSADKKSKDFLERFLSLYETMQSSIDEKINSITRYFDPRVTPEEFLPWLSMWFGHRLDQRWTTEKARMLLESLPKIYKNRGTRRGLEEILSIYLGNADKPIPFFKDRKFMIIENFQINSRKMKDDYTKLFGNNPFSFFVLLDSLEIKKELVDEVQKIIDQEKPAHTVGNVVLVEPWFQLNMHTYLGVNTYVNKKILTIGESKLGRDSIVSEYEGR